MSFNWGSAIPGALDTLSTVWQTNEAEKEAQANREFQQGARSTAYQTAVKDMEAAGLNPAMMYDKGGSSAGVLAGATAAMPQAARPGADFVINQVNSAQADLLKAQADKVRSETPTGGAGVLGDVNVASLSQGIAESVARVSELTARATREYASADQARAQTEVLVAEVPKIRMQVNQLAALARMNDAQAYAALQRGDLDEAERKKVLQYVRVNMPGLQALGAALDNYAKELAVPGRKADSAAHESFLGQYSAYLRIMNPLNSWLK